MRRIISDKTRRLKPRIGITMGDAAGIGVEVILKALANDEVRMSTDLLIIGDAKFLLNFAAQYRLFSDFAVIDSIADLHTPQEKPVIYDLKNLPEKIEFGRESAACGKASAQYIEFAVELWKARRIDAIVTAPISKKSMALAGYDYPGHTEFLARLSNTLNFAMAFFANKLRVVLLSTHVSLLDALKLVTKENLTRLIKLTDSELRKYLSKRPKIAVAGVNPHASEDGLFGLEEKKEIIPAIVYCSKELGLDVSGPYAADTIFLRAFHGEFDAVISCYHDQATIAVKCLCFEKAVNVTLGLPFVRTSVDHGTAFDIAGKNLADASSMIEAIKLARDLVFKKSEISSEDFIE